MRKTLTVPTDAEPQADPLVGLSAMDGVASALAAAQAAVDVVLRGLPRRRITVEQSTAALVDATEASARLEPDPDQWVDGCARLGGELVGLAEQVRVAPGTVVARLHLLLARGVLPDAELGRTRDGVDGARLAGVTRLLTTATAAPSMLLAAVAHAELAALRPFGAGSGIVARAVEHLVLIQARIDPVGMIMVERGHAEAAGGYAAALAAYGTGTPVGVTTWLRHCAAAVTRGAELSPLVDRQG